MGSVGLGSEAGIEPFFLYLSVLIALNSGPGSVSRPFYFHTAFSSGKLSLPTINSTSVFVPKALTPTKQWWPADACRVELGSLRGILFRKALSFLPLWELTPLNLKKGPCLTPSQRLWGRMTKPVQLVAPRMSFAPPYPSSFLKTSSFFSGRHCLYYHDESTYLPSAPKRDVKFLKNICYTNIFEKIVQIKKV